MVSFSFDLLKKGNSGSVFRSRDGVPIEFDDRTKVEDMSDGRWRLTISDAVNADAGLISCVATNECGKDECSAALRIQRNRLIFVTLLRILL